MLIANPMLPRYGTDLIQADVHIPRELAPHETFLFASLNKKFMMRLAHG
jgi:hypothetical protein